MADGTILVNLRKDWFSPDGSLYRAIDNPHEFPAAFADKPPKEAPEAQKYAVLPSTAELVESSKTVATIQNTGGGQRVMVPTAIQDDVKEVGGAVGDHGVEEPAQSVTDAAKVAKDVGVDQVGGKPTESGATPAGTKKNV